EELLGTYHRGGFYFRFTERPDGLYLERQGRAAVKLEREAANLLHEVADPTFRQAFTRDTTGTLQVTAYHTSHAPYTLTRLPTDFTDYDFTALNGQYYNAELDVTITCVYQGNQQYRLSQGEEHFDVPLFGRDHLSFNGDLLRPVRDPTGKVIGLAYDSQRVANLQLARVK
ncbi:MAG: hypothetical protein AAFZ52_00890, partial [Bacteroidota bacterium]